MRTSGTMVFFVECMSEKVSDFELVDKARAGDKQAYRALVEKYQERVFWICMNVLRSKEDAEDMAQETFVKAYLSLANFRGEAAFYTWLYRIAYNMAIDYKRKVKRSYGQEVQVDSSAPEVGDFALDKFAAEVESPDQILYHKQQALVIKAVLAEISDEHKTVFLLREVEGLSYDEISRIVGISKGTVMSRLHYARKKLQKSLAQFAPRGYEGEELKDEPSSEKNGTNASSGALNSCL